MSEYYRLSLMIYYYISHMLSENISSFRHSFIFLLAQITHHTPQLTSNSLIILANGYPPAYWAPDSPVHILHDRRYA